MGIGDLMKLMGQAGQIREQIAQIHERAAKRIVDGEAGAGMVKAQVSGSGEVLSVSIDPEVWKDPETVGPLVTAAVNLALRKSREMLMEETQQVMGGLNLPPGLLGN